MIDSSVKKTHFPTPKSWNYVSLVHSKSFIVLPFTFRILICLESILHVHYLGEGQFHFLFFFWWHNFPKSIYWKDHLSLPIFTDLWCCLCHLSFPYLGLIFVLFAPLHCSCITELSSVSIFLFKVNSLEFFSYFVWDSWGLFITKHILSERCKMFSSSLLLFLEREDFSTYVGESISKEEAENTEEGW